MHRLFAALPVPDELADRLEPLSVDMYGARWRRRDHYHVTLCFYGAVNGEVANELADALDAIQNPSIALELSGVGWFGRREPRALYARVAANEALSELAEACRKLARQFKLKLSQDPFLPHITVAYCNQTPLEAVRTWSEDFQILHSDPYLVDTFHLYESFTGHRRQSLYVAQADYRLG
ncbi:MAG: RNA 2',3'-cyclic phosphodiesterase [Henriciella sp.]|nr:RNA 2',3'-cyclic phosphodiesterase [Hyphomonadaceae bacterium]